MASRSFSQDITGDSTTLPISLFFSYTNRSGTRCIYRLAVALSMVYSLQVVLNQLSKGACCNRSRVLFPNKSRLPFLSFTSWLQVDWARLSIGNTNAIMIFRDQGSIKREGNLIYRFMSYDIFYGYLPEVAFFRFFPGYGRSRGTSGALFVNI